MNFKNYLILALFAIYAIASCKKHENPGPVKSQGSSDTVAAKNVDVYLIGEVIYPLGAAYWKNGKITKLTSDEQKSTVSAITIKDTDVYITGTIINNGVRVAVYWKNGIINQLAENGSSTTSITVNGSDVYVIGYLTDVQNKSNAVCWKNGVASVLPGGTSTAIPSGIAVSGNDVYISGSTTIDILTGNYVPVYWKNGVLNNLTSGSLSAETTGIAIKGSDVFITGNIASVGGVYWKNGILTYLTGISANAIALNGNDIYIAGADDFYLDNFDAAYWKNGVITKLGNGNPTGIAVNGKDVYETAIAPIPNDGGYWKNGIVDPEFQGTQFPIYGIALRPH